MDSPFVGPTYPLGSRVQSVARTVNMTPVLLESNDRARWVFKDVPGLVNLSTTLVPPPVPAVWLLNSTVTTGGISGERAWELSNEDLTVFVPDEVGSINPGVGNHYQGSVITNSPQSEGKRYFELEITGPVSYGAFGTSSTMFCYGLISVGITGAWSAALATFGGIDAWSINPDGAGSIGHIGEYRGDDGTGTLHTITGLASLETGTVISFACDLDAKKIWVALDGDWITGDPGAATSPADINMPGDEWSPCFGAQRALSGSTLRTIPTDFSYPMPSGYTYWSAP